MSTTKSIPTIASIAEGDSLVIKHGGSVYSAPLSTLTAPKCKKGIVANSIKDNPMSVADFKAAILEWVADKWIGATMSASLASDWYTHFDDNDYRIPNGSSGNFVVVCKASNNYFTLVYSAYSLFDAIVLLKYTDGTWRVERIITDKVPAPVAQGITIDHQRNQFKNKTIAHLKEWVLAHAQATRGKITSFCGTMGTNTFSNFSNDSFVVGDGPVWTWLKTSSDPAGDTFTFQATCYASSELFGICYSNGNWTVEKTTLTTI